MLPSTYKEYADELIDKAVAAGKEFKRFSQTSVNRIVQAVFEAGFNARIELAKMAHEETKLGVFEHKVIKNCWASLLVYENIKDQKTVGEISHNLSQGITEIAQPRGPILALTPLTNPTSTTIFKSLIALKTRNPIIFSPHGSARRCSKATAKTLYQAALKAGAPEYCIQWVTKRHQDYLKSIMQHKRLALIIATGTGSIIKEANISGKPVIGVGPGNVPVYVDSSADFKLASDSIFSSKTFDNGTVCASEQALVVEKKVSSIFEPLLAERGAYFCNEGETDRLGKIAFDPLNSSMKADAVGQPATLLAQSAGFSVPKNTKLLIALCKGIGPGHPLSYEILAPILAYYVAENYAEALNTCIQINALGGKGHTISIYTNNEKVIKDFSAHIPAGRICVNTPATQGAIGGTYNTLNPSFTLSCGTEAGNIFTDNITVSHLLNIYRVARRQPNRQWFAIPDKAWQNPSMDARKIQDMYGRPQQ